MGNITLNGATSGQITLAPTAVAGTNTLTLPAKTGNIITSADTGTVSQAMLATNVAGNGPAFFAYQNALQTISSVTITAVVFQTTLFDTAGCYNTSNGRFTPNVAGYYQIAGSVRIGFSSGDFVFGSLKNGSEYARFAQSNLTSGQFGLGGSTLVYCNGTTDYVQFMVYQGTGVSRDTLPGQVHSWFSGALVRAA